MQHSCMADLIVCLSFQGLPMCWLRFLLPSCVNTAYTQLTPFYIHFTHLCTYPIHTLHLPYTHPTFTLYTLYTHFAQALHTVCTHPTHRPSTCVHTPNSLHMCVCPPHTLRTPCICVVALHTSRVCVFALAAPSTLILHTLHMCVALQLTRARSNDCKTNTPSATCQVHLGYLIMTAALQAWTSLGLMR